MLQHTVMDEVALMLSCPRGETLVSQGYACYESGIRVFVRVFINVSRSCYVVKVKCPRHKTLHLVWYKPHVFRFEGEWVVFDVGFMQWNSLASRNFVNFDFIWFTD